MAPRITCVTHPITQGPSEARGFAERLVRRRLESHGWTVWRGGLIAILHRDDLYPNVRKKYSLLDRLLSVHHPGAHDHLKYLCAVHHGMPDFICYLGGEFRFVECKYLHERPSPAQKRCMAVLVSLGFRVEIHRIVTERQKARVSLLNLSTGKKVTLEEQKKLRSFTRYKKGKNNNRFVEPRIHLVPCSSTTMEVDKGL